MAMRLYRRHGWRHQVAWAALLPLGFGAGAAAQGQRTSAPLSVSATVVQSCTVEDVNVPELPNEASPGGRTPTVPGPSYSIRCGKQRLVYPAPPGSQARPLAKGAPVTVALTADGRAYLVQF
jgi:hypothetical protein